MKTTFIRQTATFDAAPADVYNLIMDQKKHAAFTGSKTVMSTKPGGTFTVYDGYCHGYNKELIKDRKIVQAWHFAEEGWPEDHFSICTFTFEPAGGKTKLSFLQTEVPEHKAEALKKGWKEFYWQPMRSFLKNKQA